MARLLIADDTPAIVDVLRRYLTRHGHEVETVSDGEAALTRLRSTPRPDLLIADLLMPLMGGKDLVAAMRADALLHRVPVILMSGGDIEGEAQEDAYQVYLSKPFALQAMLQEVECLLADGA
jgi:CheY-like chemotaxis protein